MKKHVFGRHFKRDANERKALFKGLMNELVMHERIQTTEHKAKAIRGKVEKLVTKAKVRKDASRQYLQPYFSSEAVEKVLRDLAPRFADRPGGYTRIVKIGRRFSDNAAMALIEWVEKPVQVEIITPIKGTKQSKGREETKEAQMSREEGANGSQGAKEVTASLEKGAKRSKETEGTSSFAEATADKKKKTNKKEVSAKTEVRAKTTKTNTKSAAKKADKKTAKKTI